MKQEFVTLPRSVVQQAITAIETTSLPLNYDNHYEIINSLRAALEQPQVEQEICCKIWSVNHIDDLGKIVDSSGRLIAIVYGSQADTIVACHNSHANQHPQSEPLTDEQITAATGAKPGTPMWPLAVAFTRAIEAAHNIK